MAKILIVDDTEESRWGMVSVLRRAGHDVTEQSRIRNGLRAIEEAERMGTPFEIVVVDLRFDNEQAGLPQAELDGARRSPETAGMIIVERAMRSRFTETIVCTAYPSLETVTEGLRLGIYRYIQKGMRSSDDSGNNTGSQFNDQLLDAVDEAVTARQIMVQLDEGLKDLMALTPSGSSQASLLQPQAEQMLALWETVCQTRGRNMLAAVANAVERATEDRRRKR